jgi:hypothetical protein
MNASVKQRVPVLRHTQLDSAFVSNTDFNGATDARGHVRSICPRCGAGLDQWPCKSRNSPRNLARFSPRSASCTRALNDLFFSRATGFRFSDKVDGHRDSFLDGLCSLLTVNSQRNGRGSSAALEGASSLSPEIEPMTKTENDRMLGWRLKLLREAGIEPRSVAQRCRHFGLSSALSILSPVRSPPSKAPAGKSHRRNGKSLASRVTVLRSGGCELATIRA